MPREDPVNQSRCNVGADRPTRRRFLGTTLAVASASVVARVVAGDPESKLLMPAGIPQSRVVRTRSAEVVVGATVHGTLLKEMIASAVVVLTGTESVREAWQSMFSSDDVIGIKFNRSGSTHVGTSPAMAAALLDSLIDAGWQPRQLVCIEAPDGIEQEFGTTPAIPGYDPVETDFGSGRDHLAAVLDQVTAIINVPFLKTHNIAGLTCAMKNLSHGLIKHPARFHRNGCSPFIADIVSLPKIRSKLRLCLVDALRVVYDGGPVPIANTISAEGTVLASTDPVAADSVGLTILNEIRIKAILPALAMSAEEIRHLAAAHRRGLGIAVRHGIEVIQQRL